MVLDHLNQPTRSSKYPLTTDQIPVLTPAAIADWNRDSRFARDLHDKMLIYHGEIISDCLEHVGQEVKESLEAEVTYEDLITSRDSFDFYEFIYAVINASGNAEIVVMRIQQYLNLKMEGNQHDTFINNIRQSEENFTRDMETIITPAMMPAHNGSLRGYVKIQHLTAAIYIAGLTGDRFQKKRDEILSANPSVKIDTIWTEINKIQQYALQMKHIHDREQGATSYAAQAARAKGVPDSSITTCKTCKTKFAAVLNFKNVPHQQCKPCYTLARDNKKHSIPDAIAAKPTEITTQKAKKQAAMVKTLLSLQLDSDEDDELGLGYVSENDDASTFCAIGGSDQAFAAEASPSTTPWYFDNAASISTCNSLSDLVDVEPITPIAIGLNFFSV